MTGRLPKRRGYALVMVVLFNVLFLMLLGVAWRRTASVIRIATVRSEQSQRDEGSLRVLANALRLLETGLPPTSPNPYVCVATIKLDSTGEERYFRVTFQRDDSRLPEAVWSVTVARENVKPVAIELPSYFQTANP